MSAQAAIASTALLLVDLQNDFLHPDGAYGRAGQTAPEIAALPARLRPLARSHALQRRMDRLDPLHARSGEAASR